MGNLCSRQGSLATKKPDQKPPQKPQEPTRPPGGDEPVHTGGDGATAKPSASLSYFASLPAGAEKVSISHVYDGDTLTINEHNRSRVRLLGVDAPELKEKEAYAQESADYLKRLCPKQGTAWLVYDKEKNDRYDRLLAYVYVAAPGGSGGYICANIVIVEEGLAGFYAPANTELSKRDVLMKAESAARRKRINIWKNVNFKETVYATRNGSAFHRADCEMVSNARLTAMTLEEALDKGLSTCRTCKPM